MSFLALAALALLGFAGADAGQVLFVEGWLAVLDHPRRPQQFSRVAVVVRQIGETAVELELQLALAAPHPPPTVEENAGDHDKPDNDKPFAQTDIHVIP